MKLSLPTVWTKCVSELAQKYDLWPSELRPRPEAVPMTSPKLNLIVQLLVTSARNANFVLKLLTVQPSTCYKSKKRLLFFRSWDMVVTGKQNGLQPRKQNGKMSFLFISLSNRTCECFVRMLAILDGVVVYLFLHHFYKAYVSFITAPYVVCSKVKFSVCLFGGVTMWPLSVMPLVSHRTSSTWTCSNSFT